MGPPLAPTRIRRARCLRRACRVCKALIASVGQQLPERSRNTVLAGETATRHGHTMDTRYPTIWLSGQHPEPGECTSPRWGRIASLPAACCAGAHLSGWATGVAAPL